MKYLFAFVLILSLISSSCNINKKVILVKRQIANSHQRAISYQPLALSRQKAHSYQPLALSRKKTIIYEEAKSQQLIANIRLEANSQQLKAISLINDGTIILSNQKNILVDDNFIGQKEKTDEKPDNRIINDNALTGFNLSLLGIPSFCLVFLSESLIILPIIVFLIGFIFSLIGFIEIIKEKARYKGIGYAIFGLLFSFIGGAFLIMVLIILSNDM